jgi:4-amino-4-deoxy-L-arabinose transferase-like glycosyltransferase
VKKPGREKEMLGRKGYIFVLVVLQTILGLACLEGVPRIYVDEAWDSALGYNLARTGALKHPFIEGFGGMNVHFVQNRVVLPLVCAAIYKVAGYSVLTSRLASVIFAILAVVSLYTVMQRWFGEKQALWIGLATIINPWFFEVSRRVRPEIYYTALGLVFLWLIVL